MANFSFTVGTHDPTSKQSGYRIVRTIDGNRFKIPTSFDYENEIVQKESTLHFKVGYSFERSRRSYVFKDGHEYGANGMYFDRLYVLLCTAFNGGAFFIDTYLNTIFPAKFGRELAIEIKDMQDALNDEFFDLSRRVPERKDGGMDRRTSEFKKLMSFHTLENSVRQKRFDEIAKRAREHIAQCLATGRIPLQISPSSATIAKREIAGLSSIQAFFASGQLINHLSLQFEAVAGE